MTAHITATFEATNPDDHTRATTVIEGTCQDVFEAIEQLYGVSRVNGARREWGFQPKPAETGLGLGEWATQVRQQGQSLCEDAEIHQSSQSPA